MSRVPLAIHPTTEHLIGLLDAFDVALGWLRKLGANVTGDSGVLACARAVAVGAGTTQELVVAVGTISAEAETLYLIQPGEIPASVQAHVHFRKAVRIVAGAAGSAKVAEAQWAQWREMILGLLASCGRLLGHSNVDQTLHVALATGERKALARRGSQAAKVATRGDATSIQKVALGHTLLLLRERAKLTKEDCCARVTAAGKSLTVGQLTRIEAGTAAGAAPLLEVARACGSNLDKAQRIATAAIGLGANLAKLSVGVDNADWYADASAVFDERVAQALLTVAVTSAIAKEQAP